MAATSIFATVPATIPNNYITKVTVLRQPNSSCSVSNLRITWCSPSSFPHKRGCRLVSACLPPPISTSRPKTRLYVSGLSFRTTDEGLRNVFEGFGQLTEINLVMDKIANRPRGFAFLRYETEEEARKAIEGMHGKFLNGRVIFVEFAKSRLELRQGPQQNARPV